MLRTTGQMRANLLAGALAAVVLAGCGERREYRRDTPDEAIDSAQAMIVNGEADRLTDLIYAEDAGQRALLNQAGSLLGSLQRLGDAVERRFPEEIERFRAEAKVAAEENRASSWARYLISGGGPGSGRSSNFGASRVRRPDLQLDTGGAAATGGALGGLSAPRMNESQRAIVNTLLKQIFADPYGWLEEGRGKLGTDYVTDDIVALTWDDRAVAPPIGLTMRLTEHGWQLVIPWGLPGIREIRPQNKQELMVFGSILRTIENVANDLTDDVDSGRIRNLTDLADTAVEKAAIPAVLIFVAYANLIDERDKAKDEVTETAVESDASSSSSAEAEGSP